MVLPTRHPSLSPRGSSNNHDEPRSDTRVGLQSSKKPSVKLNKPVPSVDPDIEEHSDDALTFDDDFAEEDTSNNAVLDTLEYDDGNAGDAFNEDTISDDVPDAIASVNHDTEPNASHDPVMHKQSTRNGTNPKPHGKYDRKRKSALKKSSGPIGVTARYARKWRIIIMSILSIIILLGVKNAVFPQKSLSTSDVQGIVSTVTGTTEFPLSQGESIAETFIQAYIPLSGDPSASSILNTFYTGEKFSNDDNSDSTTTSNNSSTDGNVSQFIKAGPYVYSKKALSNSTANYVVSALIYQKIDGKTVMTSNGQNVKYQWVYFNVGVYWDQNKDTFSIDKNSPTILSDTSIKSVSSIPDATLPGNGNADSNAATASASTVSNFMKAWASSDQSAISTLTSSDATISTKNGLNGKYDIADASNDLKTTVYDSSDGLYRALVTVKWRDNVGTASDGSSVSVYYTNEYILKLEKGSDGKYLVQDINPYYYVPSSE